MNNLVISKDLQKIGSNALYGCYSMKNIYLPDNLKYLK
ncbi:MAG: hypothetical protein ACLU9M_03205 [Lachnospirales bacterium]